MRMYKGGKIYYLNRDSPTTFVELIANHEKCSRSEAIRLIKSGGVKINQVQCTAVNKVFRSTDEPREYAVHVGKFDSFILLLDHDQLLPSENIVLLKWQKQMKSNPSLTKELVLSWEFKSGET